MSRWPGRPRPLPDEAPNVPMLQRVVLILCAVLAMAGAGRVLQQSSVRGDAAAAQPASDGLRTVTRSIEAEAAVFRTSPTMLSVEPGARRRANVHPRTLATYRLLRSYPGAPPRVPHGLTASEFRTNRCNTCHERGGFSARFGAYVPVNPHPEREQCLQCHATNEALVGVSFPQASGDDACRQCHAGVPSRFEEDLLDWITVPFPALARRTEPVPPIPHRLESRGNCVTCHAGPGAVAEIRVRHPDRANCRQCHIVEVDDGDVFTRSVTDRLGRTR